MKPAVYLVALYLGFSVIGWTQQSSNTSSQLATLEGTVVNIQNGRNIPRAAVVLRNLKQLTEARSVHTDGQGHFLVKDVEPGSYRVSAEHPSYFSNTRHQVFQYRVDLGPGEHHSGIVLSLQPAAVITGQITDEHSDPVEDVQVQLLDRSYRNGRTQLEVVGTAVSDDRGDYRIYNVRPGNYLLVAQAPRIVGGKNNSPTPGSTTTIEPPAESDIAYSPIIYPDAADLVQAQTFPLAAGEEAHVNLAFAARPSVSLRGKVVNGITGDPGLGAAVETAWSEYLDLGKTSAKTSADGSFEMRGLAPGTYTLRAAFTIDGAAYTTQRRVEIGNLGLEDVVLEALPDSAVHGTVRVEVTDPDQTLAKRVDVDFQSNTSPAHSTAAANLRVGAALPEYTFETQLRPGDQYTVRVRGLLENDYLKSVQINGHAVERNEVTSSDQLAEIDIVINPAGGYIEGLVLDEAGQPLAGSAVVLAPEDSKRAISDLFRKSASDKDGKFKIRGVPPGSYQLYAFDDIDLNELISQPDVLKRFDDRAVAVTVEEQMDYGAALKIIRASEANRP